MNGKSRPLVQFVNETFADQDEVIVRGLYESQEDLPMFRVTIDPTQKTLIVSSPSTDQLSLIGHFLRAGMLEYRNQGEIIKELHQTLYTLEKTIVLAPDTNAIIHAFFSNILPLAMTQERERLKQPIVLITGMCDWEITLMADSKYNKNMSRYYKVRDRVNAVFKDLRRSPLSDPTGNLVAHIHDVRGRRGNRAMIELKHIQSHYPRLVTTPATQTFVEFLTRLDMQKDMRSSYQDYFMQLEIDNFVKEIATGDIEVIFVTSDKNQAKSRNVKGARYFRLKEPLTLRGMQANARQIAAILFELTIETPILEIKTKPDNKLRYLSYLQKGKDETDFLAGKVIQFDTNGTIVDTYHRV